MAVIHRDADGEAHTPFREQTQRTMCPERTIHIGREKEKKALLRDPHHLPGMPPGGIHTCCRTVVVNLRHSYH